MDKSKKLSRATSVAFIAVAITHLLNAFGTVYGYGVSIKGLLLSLLPIGFYLIIALLVRRNKNSYMLTVIFGVMAILPLFTLSVPLDNAYTFIWVLSLLINASVIPIWLLAMSISFTNARQVAHPSIKYSETKFTLLNIGLILSALLAVLSILIAVSQSFENAEYLGFFNLIGVLLGVISSTVNIISLFLLKSWLFAKRMDNIDATVAAERKRAASANGSSEDEVIGKGINIDTSSVDALSAQATAPRTFSTATVDKAEKREFYISIGIHVCLLLFTFGIWQLIWIYKATKFSNKIPGEREREPIVCLLLYLFIPFYYIYWTYVIAERIDKIARLRCVESDIALISVLLSLFIGIVPPILMQDKINEIITEEKSTENGNAAIVSELERYQRMRAQGLITTEEYEAKRRELLGL